MALFSFHDRQEPTVDYFNFTPSVRIGGSSLSLNDEDAVGYRMGHWLTMNIHLVFTVNVSANSGAITMIMPFSDLPDVSVTTQGTMVVSNTQNCVAPAGYNTLAMYIQKGSSTLRFAWTGDAGTTPLLGTHTIAGTKVLGGQVNVLLDRNSFSV